MKGHSFGSWDVVQGKVFSSARKTLVKCPGREWVKNQQQLYFLLNSVSSVAEFVFPQAPLGIESRVSFPYVSGKRSTPELRVTPTIQYS